MQYEAKSWLSSLREGLCILYCTTTQYESIGDVAQTYPEGKYYNS